MSIRRPAHTALSLFAVLVALGLAAAAVPAAAAVWTSGPTTQLIPSTPARSTHSLTLYAAGGEYESAQIALRGADETVTLDWAPGSDPLLTGGTSLFRVGYVTTTRPSCALHLRVGSWPDPLLPVAFGAGVHIPATTTSFFVCVHVPYGTTAGTYTGTIEVTEPGGVTAVPVTLRVWAFGWQRLSMHTSFPINVGPIAKSVAGTGVSVDQLLPKYYQYWADHGLSPRLLDPLPSPDRNTGHAYTSGLAASLSPWLDGTGLGGPGFLDTQFALVDHWPWKDWSGSKSQIETWVADLVDFYRDNGWRGKTYAYVVDEPFKHSKMLLAQQVAQIIHAGSARAGFREPFLLTDTPRSHTLDGLQPNTFLWDDVDIWCPRIFQFWYALPDLNKVRAKGKHIWWYDYASSWSGRYPAFLIDLPNTGIRAMQWMAARWNVEGLLYWATNDWVQLDRKGYRDPYTSPASFRDHRGWIANGETSFVYPGYEPSRGLDDPTAGPVGSLRMEALRDGFEDYQYMQIAKAAAKGSSLPGVAAYPDRVASTLVHPQYGPYTAIWQNNASWTNDPSLYVDAKIHLGTFIERLQAGKGLVVAKGVVKDASTGKPVYEAGVSDGIVSTVTGRDGSFSLSGVLPQASITVSQPRYKNVTVAYTEGDPALKVALTPVKPYRLLAGFESSPGFALYGGSASLTTAYATTGSRSCRLRFTNWQAALSVPAAMRDLGAFRQLGIDVYDPQSDVKGHEWYLYFTALDAHGHQVMQRFLLAPHAENHLSLSLAHGSFDRRHVTSVTMYVYPVRGQVLYADTLFAK